MEDADRRAHWERVWETRAPDAVSWYQPLPARSLAMIARARALRDAPILDVGAGASGLVDALLAEGFTDVTVLDVSERALDHARARLGERAREVRWLRADVTEVALDRVYRVWHDRAVFHFLTDARERERYRALLHDSVAPGGHVIVATFALDGPERCSGLPIVRYSPETLLEALGPGLALEETVTEEHLTPAGGAQRFVFCRLRRV
jgi:SAM-dependent methyltransferase